MKSDQKNITIITNLYPLPWEPNRATFNRQQFAQLDSEYNKSVLVPVAFSQWFKHRKQIKQTNNLRFVPYFYLPKIGRRFYSVFLFLSILIHSGLWLRRRKPSIIFASWAFPEAVAAGWLSRLFSSRFYFKVHGSDINLHGTIPARAKQIISASKHASGILSVSKALAKQMTQMGINKGKISVIYNGVDHDLFSNANADFNNNSLIAKLNLPTPTDYILYVGNLKTEKGVDELLHGFAEMRTAYPHLQLIYAGPGALKNELQNKAITLKITNRVHFLGSVNHAQLPALIGQAKILALPSYNEGVPNVVLEAMACGTPVLATDVGGIPEVVNETICGKLIPAKSSTAVARGLVYILEKSWDKEKIQQHSASFSWDNNKKELLDFLS